MRAHGGVRTWGPAVTSRADQWIRRTTIGCVGMLALIAGTVSYLHMHLLAEVHGQPGWVAALTPLSVDGMIVAASTTLLADLRGGARLEKSTLSELLRLFAPLPRQLTGDAFGLIYEDFITSLDELGALDEHAARAAGRIEDLAMKRFDDLDDQPDDRVWREELTAQTTLARGEI